MADITISHVISGTVTVEGDIRGTIAGQGDTPAVLESLTVRPNPAQSQTLTPEAGIDGWNSVTVPQSMAVTMQSTFLIGMGGDAYDTIASKEYIAIYDTSGRNATRFYKGSGGGGVLNTGINEELASYSYYGNTGVDEIVCPNVTTVAGSAFESSGFKTIRFTGTGNLYIDNGAFKNSGLKDLYLHSSTMTSLGSNYAFQGVTGLTIHVPQNLLATYQANSMWSAVNCTWVAI